MNTHMSMDAETPTFGTKSERYRGRVKWLVLLK